MPNSSPPTGVASGLAASFLLDRLEAVPALIGRHEDFLFVAGRHANDKGTRDVLWSPGQNR